MTPSPFKIVCNDLSLNLNLKHLIQWLSQLRGTLDFYCTSVPTAERFLTVVGTAINLLNPFLNNFICAMIIQMSTILDI